MERCYFSLGDVYMNKNDLESAILNYEQVIEINPKISEAYLQISKAYYLKGDGYNTKLYFDRAAASNPNLLNQK